MVLKNISFMLAVVVSFAEGAVRMIAEKRSADCATSLVQVMQLAKNPLRFCRKMKHETGFDSLDSRRSG